MNLTITPMNAKTNYTTQQNKSLNFKNRIRVVEQLVFQNSEIRRIGNNSFFLDDFRVKDNLEIVEWAVESADKFFRELFKNKGIKRVIDMADEIPTLPAEKSNWGVEQLGINMQSDRYPFTAPDKFGWSYFKDTSFLARPPFTDYKNQNLSPKDVQKTEAYIKKFVRFIQMLQEGDVLIWDKSFEQLDKSRMFSLNKFFNPQADENALKWAKHPYRKTDITAFKNLYQNLTEADKAAMNWTKEFDAKFMQRLNAEPVI